MDGRIERVDAMIDDGGDDDDDDDDDVVEYYIDGISMTLLHTQKQQ